MPDPFWPSVKLLTTYDSDNSDVSAAPKTATNHSTTINATNFQFGGGALDTTTAGSFVSYAPSVSIGAQPFTIECWARITGTWPGGSSSYELVGQWGTTNNFFFGYDNNLSTGFVFYMSGDFAKKVASVNPADNNFHHYCVDRDSSNTLRLYIDGVVKATFTTVTNNIAATDTLSVGHANSGGSSWPGQIDEVRITIGVARYAGAFTPSAVAFPIGGMPALPTPPPFARTLNPLAFELDPDLDVRHPLSLFRQRSAITIQPTSTSHARVLGAVAEYVATNASPSVGVQALVVEYVAQVLKPTAPPPMLRVRLAWDEFNDQDDPQRRAPFQRLSPVPFAPPSPALPAGIAGMLRHRLSWAEDEDALPLRVAPTLLSVSPLVSYAPAMLRARMAWEDEDGALPISRTRARRSGSVPAVAEVVDYAVCVIT